MKIEKIRFNNHPVLENLKVDFTDENGKTLDMIVIIGENGTGKTQLLESIFSVVKDSFRPTKEWKNRKGIYNQTTNIVGDFPNEFDTPKIIWMPAELNIDKDAVKIKINNFGVVEIASQYSLKEINDYISEAVNDLIYQDIYSAPKERIEKYCQEINDIFDILELDAKLIGVEISSNKIKTAMFENRRGVKFAIDELSSGEKHLFFRVLFLRKLNLDNSIILIDEPETSLHPEWQRKIIDVYQKIGKNNQFIIATHSPFIIGSVPSESIRIMKKDEAGKISVLEQDKNDKTYGKSVEDILKITMALDSLRNEETTEKLDRIRELLEMDAYDSEDYQVLMAELQEQLGTTDRDIMRIEMQKAVRLRKNAESK